MIRIVRIDDVYLEDGYDRWSVHARDGVHLNGDPQQTLPPGLLQYIPQDHPARAVAVAAAAQWDRIEESL